MSAYLHEGLKLYDGCKGHEDAVRDLQHDLRAMGYLYMDVDGIFGSGTSRAIRALQYDLINNHGLCFHGRPQKAPVDMTEFNRTEDGAPLVQEVNGICDQSLAQALTALMESPDVGHIPQSQDPAEANRQARECIAQMPGTDVPPPFALAIALQESGGDHFRTRKADHYLTVALDHDDRAHPDHITSRGYGLGLYTLYYQPPGPDELKAICEPVHNVEMLASELKDKFDHAILGGTADSTADDRIAEHGREPLRHCKYDAGDPRYQKDCAACARAAKKIDIRHTTPLYPGAQQSYRATLYYQGSTYNGVPDPAAFACDWPYAVRCYNGVGVNSYHYQAHVLLHLLHG